MNMSLEDKNYMGRIKDNGNELFVVVESYFDPDDFEHGIITDENGKVHLTKPMSLNDAKQFFYNKVEETKSPDYPYDYPYDLDYYDNVLHGLPEDEPFTSKDYLRAWMSFGCGYMNILTLVSVDNFKKIEFDNN